MTRKETSDHNWIFGILVTIVFGLVAAAFYLGQMDNSVSSLQTDMHEMKTVVTEMHDDVLIIKNSVEKGGKSHGKKEEKKECKSKEGSRLPRGYEQTNPPGKAEVSSLRSNERLLR